jgi:protein YibB
MEMSEITIVTAFFDIDRHEWTPDKGLPHFLHRTSETYLERFGYLARMDQQMIIFTEQRYASRIAEYRKGKEDKTKIVVVKHPRESHRAMRESISTVQQSIEFQSKLTPRQRLMPEAWSPDFCLVTDLKAFYTNQAVEMGLVENDMVAWIDFGYARTPDKIPSSRKWNYDFNQNKIHLFPHKELGIKTVEQTIYEGDVIVFGAFVVAHKSLWKTMSDLMEESFNLLLSKNVVDDDQGLWLQSSLLKPELFEMHLVPDHQVGHDPFVVFEQFNNA